ncbi:MAG: hypothetical protein ACR2PG_13120 [Hyphomicrobiaceae bacterium]
MELTASEKHRVIRKFFPTFRGHLLEGDDLEGYFSDAIAKARRKGWTDEEIARAGKTGKWKKDGPPPSPASG